MDLPKALREICSLQGSALAWPAGLQSFWDVTESLVVLVSSSRWLQESPICRTSLLPGRSKVPETLRDVERKLPWHVPLS